MKSWFSWFDPSTLQHGRTQAHLRGINSCIHNIHPALKCCLQWRKGNVNTIIDLSSIYKSQQVQRADVYKMMVHPSWTECLHKGTAEKSSWACVLYYFFLHFHKIKSLKTREISALKIPREVMDQLMQRTWLRFFPDATSICTICPRPCNHSLTRDCSHRELLLQVWLGIWGSTSLWLELRRTRHHRTECKVQTLTGSWRLKLSRQSSWRCSVGNNSRGH